MRAVSLPQRSSRSGSQLLLLLHPLGVDGHFWQTHVNQIRDRDVWAPDLPGHGATPAPQDVSIEGIAASVVDQLPSPDRRLTVVGVSIGGLVAQHIALAHPGRVDRLVLIDCVAHYPPPWDEGWRERASLVREHGTSSVVEATLAGWFTEDAVARQSTAVAYARDTMVATDPEGYARSCEALSTADTTADLHRIAARTLILCGRQDLSLFQDGARQLAKGIPGAELTWLDGKHGVALEKPKETTAVISAFLDRTDGHQAGARSPW